MSSKKSENISLENIIANLPGSVYWKNRKGQYLGCNDAMASLFGLSKKEIIGHDDYYLGKKLGWPISVIESIRQVDLKVIESGVPQLNFDEIPFTDKHGAVIRQKSNKVPLFDNSGLVIGILGNSVDITKHKKAEERLHNAELENDFSLESIIACIPGSVYWKNRAGQYVGCNNALIEALGIHKEDIIGHNDFFIVEKLGWPSSIAESLRETDLKVMKTGAPIFNLEEIPFYDKNGNIIQQITNKVPLYNKQGSVIGVLGNSVDITDRKKMEEELVKAKNAAESASYLITEFVSNMGHDLATPISDVGGIAQLLLNYVNQYPELKEDIEILATRSEDCEKVRNQILSATSISNLEIKPERFSVSLELLSLEKELRPTIGSKNLKIIINPLKNKKEDFIITDRTKFRDIMRDLLSNAINFTAEGLITLSILKLEGCFDIKVADTGIGIPSDKFDYIFQQYTKLSRSNKYGATFKGVGAGLYLARIRAHILNASISIESEVGKGSTFTLSIPAHAMAST